MKETGILRRIDELGRIVLPKEIRKKLKIRDGDNLDIFTDGDNIVLQKYNPLNDLDFALDVLLDLVKRKYDIKIFVCDFENVISSSKKEVSKGLSISQEFSNLIQKGETIHISKEFKITQVYQDLNFTIRPIYSYGSLFGTLVYFNESSLINLDIIDLVVEFCVNYIET